MLITLTDGTHEVEVELVNGSESELQILLGWLPPAVSALRREQGRFQPKLKMKRKPRDVLGGKRKKREEGTETPGPMLVPMGPRD